MIWLRRTLLVIATLLLTLAITLGWLSSAQGSRWLLMQLPGIITLGNSQGSLLNTLTLDRVQIQHADFTFTADRLMLRWNPWALLHGSLDLERIAASRPHLRLTPPPDTSRSPPGVVVLPRINLPLALNIDQLQLDEPSLEHASGRFEANQIVASGSLLLSRLTLQSLAIDHPWGQLSAQGSARLSGDYPLRLETNWRLTLPEQPSLEGQGRLQGSATELQITQQLTLPTTVELNATLRPLAPSLPWQLALKLPQLRLDSPELGQVLSQRVDLTALPAPLQPLLAEPINLQFNASGSAKTADATINLLTQHPELGRLALAVELGVDAEHLRLKQSTLTLSEHKIQLAAKGQLQLSDPVAFDLTGNWQRLRYPLTMPLVSSSDGHFTLDGTVNHYSLTLNANLDPGEYWPATTIRTSATGNQSELNALALQLNTPEGAISYQGTLAWMNGISWHGQITAAGVNPEFWVSGWPGELSADSLASGKLRDESLQIQLSTARLSGILRGQPVELVGELGWRDGSLHSDGLSLTIADSARFDLSGSLNERWELGWQLTANPIPPLPFDLSGTLRAAGRLGGPLAQPEVTAELNATSLRYGQYATEQVNAELQLNLTPGAHNQASLTLTAPSTGDYQWLQLSLNLDGSLDRHRITLALDGAPLNLALHLDGNWSSADWNAQPRALTIATAELGNWQLESKHRGSLMLSTERFKLDELCLSQQPAQLCVAGGGDYTGNLNGNFSLLHLPLATLLGEQLPLGVRGELELRASGELEQGRLTGLNTQAEVTSGEVEITPELWLPIEHLAAQATGDERRIRWQIDAKASELGGEIAMQGTLDNPMDQPLLDATATAAISDFQLLPLLLPEIRSPRGQLHARLKLRGDPLRPGINGKVILDDAAFTLPATGIQVERMRLALNDDPSTSDQLLISGEAYSGDGHLRLGGALSAQTGDLSLRIEGNDFLAVAIPEAEVYVTPQLDLTLSPQALGIEGEVLVPKARLTPPDLSGKIQPSSDVVFVGESEDDLLARDYHSRIRLQLGDDVQFKGAGFETLLQGGLLLEDDNLRGARASGSVQVRGGQYRLYGQELNIDRGRFIYSGGPVDNPGLDIRISRKVEDVIVGAEISGSLQESQFNLFSNPAMPDPELLSYLLLGRAPGNSEVDEQALALRAAMAMGVSGGNKLGERITKVLPVDEMGLSSDDADNASFYVGKYLSPKMYVRYGVGLIEPTTTFFMRYKLSDKWNFESETGTYNSAADLIYTIER
ncbi:translocation/assembly module TamB domain-containing protein [Motiliproteus sediminis]|uniref:translocation/assembly module TamB domain-containing protein n=1 Tax=Motiliproteus sediminis TaxID=1468178 RepID=UPI001AF01B77|nr:translocation/assembly module TamB domain-containing protein [Motiliproteus sediminis]